MESPDSVLKIDRDPKFCGNCFNILVFDSKTFFKTCDVCGEINEKEVDTREIMEWY